MLKEKIEVSFAYRLERSKIILFLALLLPVGLWSEGSFGAGQSSQSYKYLLKPYIEAPGYEVNIKSQESGRQLTWVPNSTGLIGVDLYIKDLIGFGLGLKTQLSKEDQVKRGSTEYRDWRLSLAYPRVHLALNYQSYQGFYLRDTATVNPSWSDSEPYLLAPALVSENASITATYIFSPERFSLVSVLDQTERQTKSGGSWLAGGSLARSSLANTEAIIPVAVQSDFGRDAQLEKAEFYSLMARGGYGYTVALFEDFFASATGLLGLGYQIGSFSTSTESKRKSEIVPRIDFLLGLGYNGPRFVAGGSLAFESTDYKTESIEIPSTLYDIKVYVGGRF